MVKVDNVGPKIIDAELPVDAAIAMLRYCQKIVKEKNFIFHTLTVEVVETIEAEKLNVRAGKI
jgi:hypothetical protein